MSRSSPTTKSQTTTKYEEVPEAERYYIGRNPITIPLQKQSKYDKDMLSLPTILAEVEDADYKYNPWDLDEPEHH